MGSWLWSKFWNGLTLAGMDVARLGTFYIASNLLSLLLTDFDILCSD